MSPSPGAGAFRLIKAAHFFVAGGAQFHEGNRPALGAKDDLVVGHNDGALAGAAFIPHHLAVRQAQAGKLAAVGAVDVVAHTDGTAVVVRHAGAAHVLVDFIGDKLVVLILNLEPVTAHAVGAGDE